MPTYELPAQPVVAAAIAQGKPVFSRLLGRLAAQGYVVGEGGVQLYRDGRATIDADRDPAAEWAAFNPATPTAAETARAELRAQVIAHLLTLDANRTALGAGIATLKGPTPPGTVAALRPYVTQTAEMLLDVTRGQERLIRVLSEAGVLDDA